MKHTTVTIGNLRLKRYLAKLLLNYVYDEFASDYESVDEEARAYRAFNNKLLAYNMN